MMKGALNYRKGIAACFLALFSLLCCAPSFAEDYDALTQMIVDIVNAKMAKQGYSEDEYVIKVDENGDVDVVINKSASLTASPAPTPEALPVSVPDKTQEECAIAYANGLSLENSGDWIKAVDAFVESEGYRDSIERIIPYLEDYVYEMFDVEEYRKAQSALLLCDVPELSALLAECNDHCFIVDLADGLEARWSHSEQDTTLLSDREYREYIKSLINDELFYISKYAILTFTDETLAQYAYGYLGALQSQQVGIEYYAEDDASYTEYYFTYGYDVRAQMLYCLNRKYGLKVDSRYNNNLKGFVARGKALDMGQAIERSMTEQIRNLELNFKPADHGCVSQLYGFTFKNTSGYEIEILELDLLFLDESGNIIQKTQQIYYGDSIRVGDTMPTDNPIYTYVIEAFSSIEIAYSYYISGTWFRESVAPRQQWSFDGRKLYEYFVR